MFTQQPFLGARETMNDKDLMLQPRLVVGVVLCVYSLRGLECVTVRALEIWGASTKHLEPS